MNSLTTVAWVGAMLVAFPAACSAQQGSIEPDQACVVSHVSDGDSFRCRNGWRVRLIGIDAPESQQRPFGARSREGLHRMMPIGTRVRLERDVSLRDRYGRHLAYAWVGSILINEAMVRDGWAVLYTVPPDVKYAERLRVAQNEARARRTGLWAEGGFGCLPSSFRRRECLSSP